MIVLCFFFFKQKTAYEMRISDWSSDVCSSDLSSQPRLDPWRSASARPARRPAAAKAAARWVAMVVLPQPPLGLATRTVIMQLAFPGLVPERLGGGEGLPGAAHLQLDIEQRTVVPADHLADGTLHLPRAAARWRLLGEVYQQVLGDRHIVQVAEALLQVAQRGEIALAALGRIEAAEELRSVAQLLHGDTRLVALRGGQLRKAPAALQRLAVALGEQRVGESDERLGERHLPCRLPCRFWAPAAILQPAPEAQQEARVARRGQRLAELQLGRASCRERVCQYV